MKKSILHVVAFFPLIFLFMFYLARIVFHMRDATMFGIILIVGGAFLSFTTPFILGLIALTTKSGFNLRYHFLSCGIAGGFYWIFCFLDPGKELHRFIAA